MFAILQFERSLPLKPLVDTICSSDTTLVVLILEVTARSYPKLIWNELFIQDNFKVSSTVYRVYIFIEQKGIKHFMACFS
jgi:hypothetical protein